jgi:hypothetical protein
VKCKRVLDDDKKCSFCNNESVKELNIGAPVNIIGSKLKGKILKIDESKVRLLIKDESNNRYIKEYEHNKLRKVV